MVVFCCQGDLLEIKLGLRFEIMVCNWIMGLELAFDSLREYRVG